MYKWLKKTISYAAIDKDGQDHVMLVQFVSKEI
jgi:hypothetical protein